MEKTINTLKKRILSEIEYQKKINKTNNDRLDALYWLLDFIAFNETNSINKTQSRVS